MENVLHENNPFRETIVRQLREVLMVNQNRLGMSAHEAIFVWHLMGEKVVDGLIVPNVQEIAIKTGFNRSTFYVLAVDMQKRGLLKVVEDGKKKRVNLEPLLEMLMALMRNEVVVVDNKSDGDEAQKVLSETTTKSGKIASLKEDSESSCCSEQQPSKNELSSVSINSLKALKTTDVSNSIYTGKEKVRESKSNGKENEEEKENGEEKGSQNKEDGGKRKRRSKNGIPIASEPSAPDDLAEEDDKSENDKGEYESGETDTESDVVNAADVKAMRTRVKTGGSNAFIEAMNNFGAKKETEYTAKDCAFYYKQEYEKTYKSTYYLSTKEVGMVTNMVKMYEEVGGVAAVVKMIRSWINDYERLPFLNGSRGDVPTIPHMVSMRHALCLWALNDGERGAMKRDRVKNTPKGNELPPDALDMTGIY